MHLVQILQRVLCIICICITLHTAKSGLETEIETETQTEQRTDQHTTACLHDTVTARAMETTQSAVTKITL